MLKTMHKSVVAAAKQKLIGLHRQAHRDMALAEPDEYPKILLDYVDATISGKILLADAIKCSIESGVNTLDEAKDELSSVFVGRNS
jgi:hypothetical protein